MIISGNLSCDNFEEYLSWIVYIYKGAMRAS